MALSQEARDREARGVLEAKLLEKLARADIIAEQRASIAEELQRMRKDIAQQEAWVKVGVSLCLLMLGHRERADHTQRDVGFRVHIAHQEVR